MKTLNKEIINKKKRPIKVLQIGEGNFLRAFVDWFLQQANDKGVICTNVAVVQPREGGRVKEIEKQDGLYTVLLQGLKNGKVIKQTQVIDVLDDFINPYTNYQKYLSYASSEDLRFIISNTTEAGIVLDRKDKDFKNCPKSYPGKLLILLYKRYLHFNGDINKGLIILPCELIVKNGEQLKRVLNELAVMWKLEPKFIEWLNKANTFCNTLVDRIVPGYPKEEIESLTSELGYIDTSIVKGEIFHLWVIEADSKVQKEFPLNEAGLNVLFVNDLMPYEERKVRILNGAHTCMVPVAYLYGIDTVREAIENEIVGKYVKNTVFNEIIPTLSLPKDELLQFAEDVLERFKNPFIRHELISISLNSTTKYKTRVLPSVLAYIKQNKQLPKNLLFSLASLIVFFKGNRNGEKIPLNDNKEFLKLYKRLWETYDGTLQSIKNIVKKILSLEYHWGMDLNKIEGLEEYVSNSVYSILNDGMSKALKRIK